MSATTPMQARVLVADDDPTVVLLLEHALEGMRRDCDSVADGDAAWQSWQEKRHDLVVLDIEMPGIDGLEVCRRIRAAEGERQTYVVLITGRDKASDLEVGLDAGADDYVTKPIVGQRLVARLRIAQRRMEEDRTRRRMQEELQRARWMAGVGEAMVALQHEINNPLAGLLATAELLLIEGEDQGRPMDDLRVIVDQARRISALVRRMGEVRDPKSVAYAGGAKMVDLGEPS